MLELFNDSDDFLLLRNGLILVQVLTEENNFRWVLHDEINGYEDPSYICQRLSPILNLDSIPEEVAQLPLDVKAVVATEFGPSGDRHTCLTGDVSLYCYGYPEKRLAFGLMVSNPDFYQEALNKGFISSIIAQSEIVPRFDLPVEGLIKKFLTIIFERATEGFRNLELETIETSIQKFIEHGKHDLRNLRGAILPCGDDYEDYDNCIRLRLIKDGTIFHITVHGQEVEHDNYLS